MIESAPDDPRERQRALAETFADPAAFREWYEDALRKVYSYLYTRSGGDAALAEEVTQQTFIQAIERRDTYEGRSSATTWLITIARNKLADHYRHLDREERRHLRLVVREISVAPADRGTAGVDDRDLLLSALRQLPALQRAVIVLCYVDGLSVREASGILRRTESATESLLSRGRARLRQLLESPDGR